MITPTSSKTKFGSGCLILFPYRGGGGRGGGGTVREEEEKDDDDDEEEGAR